MPQSRQNWTDMKHKHMYVYKKGFDFAKQLHSTNRQ